MRRQSVCLLGLLVGFAVPTLFGQTAPPEQLRNSEQVQIGPPVVARTEAPSPNASPEELEKKGDELRKEKAYLDALDYFHAALVKKPEDVAILYNKIGITELLMQRYKEARKNLERAVKSDRQYADAYNNLGVVYYLEKKYGNAIKQYEKAIALRQDSASYFSNLGAAYFSKKEMPKAIAAYAQALSLDPDIFERTSRGGVAAQMSSPEDRAHFDYVLARLYAKAGVADRSLIYLRRAMEEGYKGINDVYKDTEFTELRKDPRFSELMAARPPGIPE